MTRINSKVERYRLGELTPSERAEVEALPDLAERLAAIEASDAEILEQYSPTEMTGAILRRAHVAKTRESVARRKRASWVAGMLVPLAVAAGFLVTRPDAPVSREMAQVEEGARPKSGHTPSLFLYQQTGDGPERLVNGSEVREGDIVQPFYEAKDWAHGVIVSIDGRGAVTLHHPAVPSGDTGLVQGERVGVAHGYALDDAPEYERFFLVGSDAPLSAAWVVEAAEDLIRLGNPRVDPIELGPDTVQTTVLLEKAP